MQPLIVVIYIDQEENLISEIIDFHYDLHELGKYHFFHSNSIIIS